MKRTDHFIFMKFNQKLSQKFFEWVIAVMREWRSIKFNCYLCFMDGHKSSGEDGGRGEEGDREGRGEGAGKREGKGGGALFIFSIATSLNIRLDSPKLGSSL